MRSSHVSVVVRRTPDAVYEYVRDAHHLPQWAAGLATGEVHVTDDAAVVDSPMGRVRLAFVQRNDHGVLDHLVELPSGEEVLNPMRVVAHPEGSEVLFTVRQRDLTDDEFTADVAAVQADLARLAEVLER